MRRLGAILGLVVSAATAACAGDPGPGAASAEAPLEPWLGPYQGLYDDNINPASFGFDLDGRSPAFDPLLPHRTKTADLVARMRVQTVTRGSTGERTRYKLSLQVGQPPLAAPKIDEQVIELTIASGSPAFGLVTTVENSLRGRTFIGFVRRFAGQDGPVLHWHLTSDTPEVARAVQQIAALGEVSTN